MQVKKHQQHNNSNIHDNNIYNNSMETRLNMFMKQVDVKRWRSRK